MSEEIRVLHVDGPEVAETSATLLEREDGRLRVETAKSAAEGCDRLAGGAVDCIVSAYDVPDADGVEFLESVRETHPELPFILFPDGGSETVASDAISAGVTDYLPKQDTTNPYAALANRIVDAVEATRAAVSADRAERQLRELTESADDIFWIYAADWDELLFVNSAVEEVFGIGTDQLRDRPRSFLEAIHPDDRERTRTAMDRLSAGHSAEVEYRVNETEGYRRWVWVQARPVVDDGTVERIVGFCRDVTGRKEHEQELERERDRLRILFNNLPNPVVHGEMVDGEPVVRHVNPAFEETFGYEGDVTVGANLDDLLVPEDDRLRAKAINERLSGGGTLQQVVRRETTDGHRDFLLNIALHEDEENVEGFAIYTDITEQKQREQTVTLLNELATEFSACGTREAVYRQSIEAAESLLEFDQAAIAVRADGRLRVVEMSEAMPLDEAPTMDLDEGIAGKTYRTGESFLIEDVTAAEDASPQTEIGSAMSVPIGSHGLLQVIDDDPGAFDKGDLELAELLVVHTAGSLERIDRERELARQNERLDEFASFVSHDLRNPLNVANLRLDLLREETDSEHIDELALALDRMEQRIEDLLARAKQGERTGEVEPVELAVVVRRSWSTVETGTATLECRTDSLVDADQGRLAAVLENLFRNAVEHGDESVTVAVDELETGGGFYVADDGSGIPPGERDRVFESGYSTAEGTGLGLAIVRDIVEAHGWEIRVTESERGGARFEITGVEMTRE